MYRLGLKLLVSIGVLFFLLKRVSLATFCEVISGTDWSYIYLSLLIYLVAQAICAFKWKLLAAPLGIIFPLKEFIAYYFIGMFFNLFLPTSMGGDIGKSYYLAKGGNSWSRAVLSVLGERVTGAISLVMILIVGSLSLRDYTPLLKMGTSVIDIITPIAFAPWAVAVPLVVFLILIVFMIAFLSPVQSPFLNQIRDHFPSEIFIIFWKRPGTVFKAIGLGLFFQLLLIVIHILIGYSLAITVPPWYYFIIYPIADLISFLPLTFNGIGLREWSYIYLLTLIGIPQEAALSFSLLWFFILFQASLLGGMVFVLGNFESPNRISLIAKAEK